MQETKAGTSTEQQGDVRHRELDLIRSVLFTYLEEGKSVSLWRLPGQAEKNVIICSQVVSIDTDQFSVEDSQPGFVISRFDRNGPKLFLPADIHLKINNGEITQQRGVPVPENLKSTGRLKLHMTKAP